MHKIEVTPAPCTHCGMGNTADSNGDRRTFVDFERDVNWNDPLILCEDCLAQAGGLIGFASKDTMVDLNHRLRDKEREIHDLKVQIDKMTQRARRVGVEFVEPSAA